MSDEMKADWATLELDLNEKVDAGDVTVTFSQTLLDEGTDDEFRLLRIRLCEFHALITLDLDEVETILKTLKGDKDNG